MLYLHHWNLQACCVDISDDFNAILAQAMESNEQVYKTDSTKQVHDILRDCRAISPKSVETGDTADCMWVADTDWMYRGQFAKPAAGEVHYLLCNGLDTVCDIFINGTHLGRSISLYLPFRVKIDSLLQDKNELVLIFHRHSKMLQKYKEKLLPRWNGNVSARSMLRRRSDYGCYPNEGHGYAPIGPSDEIVVESFAALELKGFDIETHLDLLFQHADVAVTINGYRHRDAVCKAHVAIRKKDTHAIVAEKEEELPQGTCWEHLVMLNVDQPELWWPKNYGDHPLYEAVLTLYTDGKPQPQIIKPFGIRQIKMTGNMVFEVNGVPVRFWGGNLAPLYGPSDTFQKERIFEMVEQIDRAGMNAIRIWSLNPPHPDMLYDWFDERGILVWQDFPTESRMPDTDEFRALVSAEAECMIRRLKHHPSIYLWCGGNENMYMNDVLNNHDRTGFDILIFTFRDLCARLDPERYYHISCPIGGQYPNDPLVGDSHGSRAMRSYCPGEQYAAYFSENIRVYPPQLKSFRRWRSGQLWDDSFVDTRPFGCLKPMPASWQKMVRNNGEEKFGPIQDYYAAKNAQELIYKYTQAAGQDIYQMYARARRGRPAYKSYEGEFCRGYMIWKINDPWPNFYTALIDYYSEPSLLYYTVKRAVAPVWIDFEVGDHIYLWGVNDTLKPKTGTLEIMLYDMENEKLSRQDQYPVALPANRSQILMDLDRYGYLRWPTLLYARFIDDQGQTVARTNQFITRENMLIFHEAKLTLTLDGDWLTVSTDQFARCVELGGGSDGEAFNWRFDDNFFDLFPFEERRIRIHRFGDGDCIYAKAQYSPYITYLNLQKEQ